MDNEKGKLVSRFYMALIITFTVLYLCIAFVSTLHAIAFFQLTNVLWLAILLGAAYEVGQATVLFSILMTKNKNKLLAWGMMFLLTGLQVTANVFASYKFIQTSGNTDWTYWQESILFWAETGGQEKIWISWIAGALLPVVALGLTALVADNIKLQHEKVDLDYDEDVYEKYDDYDEEDGDEGEDFPPPNENLVEAAEKYKKAIDEKPFLLQDGSESLMNDPSVQRALKIASDKHKEAIANGETFEDEPTALANSGLTEKIEEDDAINLTSEEIESVVEKELEKANFPAPSLDEAIAAQHENEGYDELVKTTTEKLAELDQKKLNPESKSSSEEFIKLQEKISDIVEKPALADVVEEGNKELDEEESVTHDDGASLGIKPVGKPPRGWHFRAEYVDEEGNVFKKGIFSHKQLPGKVEDIPVMKDALESKKAKE